MVGRGRKRHLCCASASLNANFTLTIGCQGSCQWERKKIGLKDTPVCSCLFKLYASLATIGCHVNCQGSRQQEAERHLWRVSVSSNANFTSCHVKQQSVAMAGRKAINGRKTFWTLSQKGRPKTQLLGKEVYVYISMITGWQPGPICLISCHASVNNVSRLTS